MRNFEIVLDGNRHSAYYRDLRAAMRDCRIFAQDLNTLVELWFNVDGERYLLASWN